MTTTNIVENVVTAPEFKNRKLQQYTEQIFKQGMSIKKSYARIAVTLSKIDLCQCYQADGFASVHDYASQVLGLNKSTSYALLKVGRDYIDHKTLESVLAHPEGKDFSTSQLQVMLPLKSVDDAKGLSERGEITPDMTVAEIREVVKAYKSGETESEIIDVEPVDNNELQDEEVEAMNILHVLEFAVDKDGKPCILYGNEKIGVREAKKMVGEWLSGAWQ